MNRVMVPVCEESTRICCCCCVSSVAVVVVVVRLQVSWKGLELLEYSEARVVWSQYSPMSWFFLTGWLDLRRVIGLGLEVVGLIKRRQSMRWDREPRLLAW